MPVRRLPSGVVRLKGETLRAVDPGLNAFARDSDTLPISALDGNAIVVGLNGYDDEGNLVGYIMDQVTKLGDLDVVHPGSYFSI